ncbi:vitamin B12-dependent ribonucleotide reductase [Candidatus Parcubacteria bacterium]|nr:MAG: vitamin B12-dependent ribonucleotide reductase [Candidatus Parcubacteria bacterium]
MNNPSPNFAIKADRKDGQSVSDAVWDYVTSLKTVIKKSGEEQEFVPQKIRNSIYKAMAETGLRDENRAEKIAEQVITRLQTIYDGHTIPATADIREVVSMTFIDNNLAHISRAYIHFKHTLSPAKSDLPVYGRGLRFERFFTKEGVHPYDELEWELRTAKITDAKGNIVFEQKNIEVPKAWSQTATNIVVQKYFRGRVGQSDRETSVKQLIDRVAKTIADWGRKDGYFYSAKDAQIFEEELTHLLVNQKAAFNSPVWFNVGINEHPQCSACFINSVEDDMRSILQLVSTESMLFKQGSGAGSNLSNLRSSREFLGGSNGKSSGPVSFMKGFDAFAGIIKSGGKTRRAAKMVILNIDHPDIEEFIDSKVKEEKKAWALMDAGYDGSMDGEAYSSVFFQNANNSVRVTDEFMKAVENDEEWTTYEITTGKPSLKYKARDLWRKMAQSAWTCGDPGIQYDTTINKWHTCKNSGRINASNPCSEYMFLDDTSCNLASLNLMRYRKLINGKAEFDVEAFKKAAEVIITAMEIIVGNASYPTPAIEQNSFDYRPLGIGYANLGALLMSRGLAYDSDEGRNMAAAITSVLSGHTYYQSTKIAEKIGPFKYYEKNKEPFLDVMSKHRDAAKNIKEEGVPADLLNEARNIWDKVLNNGSKYGFRNAQISVLAPTGTISFMMDCDTTGVEPDIALVKYKWLVGGGMIKIVNNTVKPALQSLGYNDEQIEEIMDYIEKQDTIEGAPHLKDEHLPVFDCAFRAKNGTRSIHYMGHLRMMAAVQPFLSGAISKTVNMPNEATVEDIEDVYMQGWKMGLKAIAIYRDGSKRQQALTTSDKSDSSQEKKSDTKKQSAKLANIPRRRRLPDERKSITHRFTIANYKGYITVGLYDDGSPGELFVTMAKQGSVISGLMDAFATSVSMALQYGVPLQVLVNKFVHMRFEPSGFTQNPNIRMAKSIVDYIFRWLALKFLTPEEQIRVGINNISLPSDDEVDNVNDDIEDEKNEENDTEGQAQNTQQVKLFSESINKTVKEVVSEAEAGNQLLTGTFDNMSDAPACDTCGSMMVRNGACYKCLNCGATSGCS